MKHLPVRPEIPNIIYLPVSPEGNIELPILVKTAEAVVAGPVQIIEEFRPLPGLAFSLFDQVVETVAALIIKSLLIRHRSLHEKTLLQPAKKINQVTVDIVEQRSFRLQPQGHGQAATKGLDQPPIPIGRPERPQARNQPSLSPDPFERRPQTVGKGRINFHRPPHPRLFRTQACPRSLPVL